tara:strand:+ start:55 stop:990 length:936 start_codon:yes stop_codon:yes gene_type:complete
MNLIPENNTQLYGYSDFFLSIKNMYDNEILPNKIIFSGSKGIGKSTLAYHLINYIFSQKEENKYDFHNNTISSKNFSYNLIKNGTHPNFFLISNNAEKSNSQIAKVREMINYTNKSSFNNKFKIILIDNIENLNPNSINALLKIVEEPNEKVLFLLIHDNKKKIINTLTSRCIKFNLFLNNEIKNEIIEKLLNNNFYANLNNDFKNIYCSPGDIVSLHNFFKNNEIDEKITIDDFIKLLINKSLFKKNSYIINNLSYFLELYFLKKIYSIKSKNKVHNFYNYFLSKISNCNKYNLDLESVLIEFDGKVLNE